MMVLLSRTQGQSRMARQAVRTFLRGRESVAASARTKVPRARPVTHTQALLDQRNALGKTSTQQRFYSPSTLLLASNYPEALKDSMASESRTNGTKTPTTPTPKVSGFSLTEYTANPSPERAQTPNGTPKFNVPEHFLLPNGTPDV